MLLVDLVYETWLDSTQIEIDGMFSEKNRMNNEFRYRVNDSFVKTKLIK